MVKNRSVICLYCKRIKDSNNYWQRVKSSFYKYHKFQFSHGICPACYEKYMKPQLMETKEVRLNIHER